jgi:hypothetical protein
VTHGEVRQPGENAGAPRRQIYHLVGVAVPDQLRRCSGEAIGLLPEVGRPSQRRWLARSPQSVPEPKAPLFSVARGSAPLGGKTSNAPDACNEAVRTVVLSRLEASLELADPVE